MNNNKIKYKKYLPVLSIGSNQYDLLLGDITIDHERMKIVDFSLPMQTSELIVLMKRKSQHDYNIFSFLKPLSDRVWLCMLVATLLGLLFLYGYMNYE